MDDQRPFVMDEETYQSMKRQTNSWYWYNVATFFRCPWDENPSNADIAFVGVPHSSGNGSTERDQHLAPRFLRHVSGFYRRCHAKYGLNPWEECRINDMGDVPLPEAMVNDICVQHIEGFYKRLDNANVRPVSIGGDHAITGPILKAIAGPNSKISGGRKAALIHFDAHTDAYEHIPHWLGAKRSAAHWAAYLVREGHVDAEKSTQIGIRGNVVTLDWRDTSHNLGYRIIGIDEFRELGVKKVVEILRERVGDSPVYITFDMDALDPVYAPAAANLEPGYSGMTPDDATQTLHGLRGLDVIGADVVCIIPSKDNPNNITSMNAMVLMFEQMCLIADRLRTLRGKQA